MAINDAFPLMDGLLRFSEALDFEAGADTIKCALVTSSFSPSISLPHPCWGAGGTTDLSAFEVTAGGNYVAGGAICANVSVTLVGDDITIAFTSPPSWASDPANPTDSRWAIFYNDSAPLKEGIGYYDFGAIHDMSSGETIITVPTPFVTFARVAS